MNIKAIISISIMFLCFIAFETILEDFGVKFSDKSYVKYINAVVGVCVITLLKRIKSSNHS